MNSLILEDTDNRKWFTTQILITMERRILIANVKVQIGALLEETLGQKSRTMIIRLWFHHGGYSNATYLSVLGQSVLNENKGLGNSILQQRPLGFIRMSFPRPSKCVFNFTLSDDGGLTVMPLRLHADLTIAFITNQRKPFNVYNQASKIRSNSIVL